MISPKLCGKVTVGIRSQFDVLFFCLSSNAWNDYEYATNTYQHLKCYFFVGSHGERMILGRYHFSLDNRWSLQQFIFISIFVARGQKGKNAQTFTSSYPFILFHFVPYIHSVGGNDDD